MEPESWAFAVHAQADEANYQEPHQSREPLYRAIQQTWIKAVGGLTPIHMPTPQPKPESSKPQTWLRIVFALIAVASLLNLAYMIGRDMGRERESNGNRSFTIEQPNNDCRMWVGGRIFPCSPDDAKELTKEQVTKL